MDEIERVQEQVRQRYAQAARAAQETQSELTSPSSDCCAGSCQSGKSVGQCTDADGCFGAGLYDHDSRCAVPDKALAASLGCGNPTAVADLLPGERVLDLGSGGGIDVLLSARRVGPTGFAYGVDMTDEMLELARVNAAKAGAASSTCRQTNRRSWLRCSAYWWLAAESASPMSSPMTT